MKKSLMAIAIIAALGSASAFACNGTQTNPNSACNDTSATGGSVGNVAGGSVGAISVGGSQATVGNVAGGSATGISGGSFGGAGGVGIGGAGGSVNGSGNSANLNTNTANGGQGGQGGAGGSVKNSGNSSIKNSGNSSISNSGNSRNTNTANGGAGGSVGNISVSVTTPDTSAAQTASADRQAAATEKAAALAAAASAAPQKVEYSGIPAATAYAAPLTASNGTCMGSTSAGFQGTLGVSFGTTWTDNSCDIRYDAEALRAAGLPQVAIARLCQKPEIAKAMEAAGTPCKSAKPTAAVKTSAGAAEEQQQVAYSDPIIRSRLGLPPLSH